ALDGLSAEFRRLIVEGAGPEDDRSERFYFVVASLREHGASASAAAALLEAHPSGIAEKYRGRITKEVERAYAKAPGRVSVDVFDDRPKLKTGSDIEIAGAALAGLRDKHGDVFHAEGAFWRYDGRRWAPIAEAELRRLLHGYDGQRAG